ncbi:3-methyl-2-oxobutanoate hydroxymethyltransferase [Anaerobranca gottschalkii]|uniref:3-methyl-2-oxobutanoate hydroxymethyltransferase n=1 Tax=Anaerobranca gottschalkii DSM 13577 TaxID=1120990 RepID=A0A1I0A003_9FIRM|nr:3-methyl-2-oxobutanoate hydroxymethyltransferase [Anaerobranca gottschalkii]SES86505.1 ketopantoate hydroxymethyltransferase [Anaerobranca gottschalkii DSM 13577]
MSEKREKKFTVSSFLDSKEKGEKITMLTAYDYTTAKLLDEAGVDSILVGDSLGMVMLGYDSTLKVTLEDVLHHTKAVVRGCNRAMVIADMPYLTYHISVEETVKNAGRLIQEGGAHAVKLEGGEEILPMVKGLIRAQIPVLGHLGLTPQSVNMMGGYKVQGKSEESAKKILRDAKLLEEAGVFGIVLECVPDRLAEHISKSLKIPTIGIGAGAGCDGQVLVIQDMLGMYSNLSPKFVKRYKNIGEEIKAGVKEYIKEVKAGSFPEEQHTFKISDDILEKLY